MSNLIGLVDELTTATTTCATLRSTVSRTLSSGSLREKLWNFVQIGPKNDGVGCCTYVASLQRQLISATTASLLIIILATDSGELVLPPALVTALINKQRKLPAVTRQCQCAHSSDSSRHPPISLFQQASTQYAGQHLQDWSERLSSELASQSLYQRDAIVRSVTQICGDLEARCNTVEEPLRKEKEKSTAFEAQAYQLNQEIESLQARLVDDGYHLQGLEKDLDDTREERDRLEQEKLEIFEEKERKCARLQEVESFLEESNRNANEATRAAQESFSAKELTLRSTILQYEEDIRTRGVAIEELHGTISELKAVRAQQERDHSSLNEKCEQYQARLHETEEMLETERANVVQQADKNARLETRVSEYQHHLEDREAELKHTTRQLGDLQASHQELEHTSDETMKHVAAKHANEMQATIDRAEEERQALSIQLETARQDYQQEKVDHDKTRVDVQCLQTSNLQLESRIQQLEDFCAEQGKRLEKHETMKLNLLAQMGYSEKPLAIRSSSRSQQETIEPQTAREARSHRRRKSGIATYDEASQATMSTQGITNTAMENLADASFASSESYSSQGGGLTPKRSKPRPSFRVPTMHTPYTHVPVLTTKPVPKQLSPSKRSALRQMSPNRRHTVNFALAEADAEDRAIGIRPARKRRGSLPDIEQVDFDMDDDFMAGTPLTPGFMTGTGRVPDEDNATTTEL
jgi:chromosome segregation ATPase